MAFVEIKRTKRSGFGSDCHASYSVSKKGIAALRINMPGIEYLKQQKIKLLENDIVKLFFDEETNKIALVRDTNGQFKLTKNSSKNETLRINASDLKKHIKKTTRYKFETSDEHDLILVPQE